MNIGDKVASCHLPATQSLMIDIANYRDKWIILYFYPKDATSGCTKQGQDFRDNYPAFQGLNAEIFGVSRDSIASHERFKAKEQFPFELISDAKECLCEQFEVIKLKNMYGKQVRGIERSTFIIDPNGIVRAAFRGVSVPNHVQEVLETLQKLQKEPH